MLKFFPGGASTVPSESAVSCCDPRSAWMRGAGAWGPGAFVVSLWSLDVLQQQQRNRAWLCVRICVCVWERERDVFACVAGWCLAREVGDPGIIKETQAERWSHPSGFEAARVWLCVNAWGLRGVEEQDWHQQARDETARYWHSLVRLREVDFS